MSTADRAASRRWLWSWRRRDDVGSDAPDVTRRETETPENRLELAALERMIRRAEGFRIAFAIVNHPPLQERLVDAVKRDLADRPIAEVTLDPTAPDGIVPAIEQAAASRAAAIFVYGLERLSPLRDRSSGFSELNLNRDHLWRTVSVPVVFWAPDFAVRAFARQAADLWSGRSGLYRFRPEAEDAAVTSGLATEDFGWSLTPEERREREALLSDLLEELDERGDEPSSRAVVLAGLGDAARMQNRYEDAIALYEQALPLYREIGDRRSEAQGLLSYGLALSQVGSQSARLVLEEAARLFELIGLAGRAALAHERLQALLEADASDEA